MYAESVRDIASAAVREENAIIVLVVTGDDDLNNSRARDLVNRTDPGGKRTIGIITKVSRSGGGRGGA